MEKAGRNSFILYDDYQQHFELLSSKDVKMVMLAIFAYRKGEELPDLSATARIAFSFIKAGLDRDAEAYQRIVERNRENGARGGRPRKADGLSGNPENPVGSLGKNKEPKKPKKAVNDNDSVNDNDNEKKERSKRFKKPSLQELNQYISEAGLNVDAQRFIDFYESKGWKVGKNPMKDWKAAARNWSRNQTEKQPPAEKKDTRIPIQFYSVEDNKLHSISFGNDEELAAFILKRNLCPDPHGVYRPRRPSS